MQVYKCPNGCTTIRVTATIAGANLVANCSVCAAPLRRTVDQPDRPPLTLLKGGKHGSR